MKTSAGDRGRPRMIALGLLIALGGTVGYLGLGPALRSKPVAVAAPVVAPRTAAPAILRARPPQVLDSIGDFVEAPEPETLTRWDPGETYRHASRHPPDSQPLSRQQRHRVEWNRRYESPRPLPGDGWWLLTADRYWITGDRPLAIELKVGGAEGPPVVAIEAARVRVGEIERPLRLTQTAEGWEAILRPAAFPGTTTRAVRIEVVVRTPTGTAQGLLNAVHVPEAALPARFTGQFADRVEDGSLRIDIGIETRRAGRYLIDANLHDGAGEPVAWARFKGELKEGAGTVPLRFFGKVLVDGERPGPWRLGELRGMLHRPGANPDLEPMEPWAEPWFTRAWPLASFSDHEWQSPRRQARLAALERLELAPSRPAEADRP